MNHQETTTKSMKQMISIDITRAQFLYNINTHDVPHPTKTNPNPQSIKKKQKKMKLNPFPIRIRLISMLKLTKSNGGIAGVESEVIGVDEGTLAFESIVVGRMIEALFELLTITGGISIAGGKSIVSNTICGALSND
eukprot:596765_1